MKYGKLKEKTMPKHGKVRSTSEPRKFLSLPEAARLSDESEHGKRKRFDSTQSDKHVDKQFRDPSAAQKLTRTKTSFKPRAEEMSVSDVLGSDLRHPYKK